MKSLPFARAAASVAVLAALLAGCGGGGGDGSNADEGGGAGSSSGNGGATGDTGTSGGATQTSSAGTGANVDGGSSGASGNGSGGSGGLPLPPAPTPPAPPPPAPVPPTPAPTPIPPPAPAPADALPTTMVCAEADAAVAGRPRYCSGSEILRADHGVGVTRSGVQVWGRSTRDEAVTAYGLAPAGFAAGMTADVRVTRDLATGASTAPALLLDRLDLSWDGKTERPPILETFHAAGEARIERDPAFRLARLDLPPSSDLGFYDYATRGLAATQAHYANNVYFPRAASNPARCPAYIPATSSQCTTESHGLVNRAAGDWRTGGTGPDRADAVRFHEDGDIHAGDAATGSPPILAGGNGFGVPFPGSKGYRTTTLAGYRHATLMSWFSQDTVGIVEWTGGPGAGEHNKNRRGSIAFGDVTDPRTVPTTGTVTYSGVANGWYAPGGAAPDDDARGVDGSVTITVDLATRRATVTLQNVGIGSLTLTLASAPATGADSGVGSAASAITAADWRNLLTTSVVGPRALVGGASARYFGAIEQGSAGTGPAELGGVFQLSDPTTGEALVGGFIARRR